MPSAEDTDNLVKLSKLRIIKNLAVISCSFVLLFTGFDALSELQSTINKEEGVGTLCQALTYVFFCISALLLPKYAIRKIGCKYSMVLSVLGYIPWIASNFYPRWGTLVPSSILTGLAASTLWSGQGTYFNKASVLFCKKPKSNKRSFKDSTKSSVSLEPLSVRNSIVSVSGEPPSYGAGSETFCNVNLALESEDNNPGKEQTPREETKMEILQGFADHESINARFFGCHFLAFKTADVWGNLLSFFVLEHHDVPPNASSCSCGAGFCNDAECLAQNIGDVADSRRYLLSSICVACAVAALLLLLFGLDQIESRREEVSFSTDMVLATWKQCQKKQQLLLVPLTVLQGLNQGFYAADFTKAYIGCAWGTYHIGMVTVGYGISSALVSSGCGWVVKHIGRVPVFSMGTATLIGTCVLLLTWTPNAEQSYVFYSVAVLWGIIVGSMYSQLPAFYGVLFKEDQEAAFASIYVWLSVGYAVAFVNSFYLCTYIKIYVLMFVGILGLIGYLITEKMFIEKKKEISDRR